MPFRDTLGGLIVEEVLLGGDPLTAIEAMLFAGYADLAKKVTRMRDRHASRLEIRSRRVKIPVVLARIEAVLGKPATVHPFVFNLLTLEGATVTEYYRHPHPAQQRPALDAARLEVLARAAEAAIVGAMVEARDRRRRDAYSSRHDL